MEPTTVRVGDRIQFVEPGMPFEVTEILMISMAEGRTVQVVCANAGTENVTGLPVIRRDTVLVVHGDSYCVQETRVRVTRQGVSATLIAADPLLAQSQVDQRRLQREAMRDQAVILPHLRQQFEGD